ncbi:MAG: linear amide C-N hydrolase [Candidatus Aminicenantes bacterium]|nr:linear amide C-N hydrolase [Candidatus Aminicenantes bacterium]
MMTTKSRAAFVLIVLILAVPPLLRPCSSLVFFNKGFPIFATNYDNSFEPGQLFINRRGLRKTGWEAGTTGQIASWTSRYGSVTIACAGYQLAWGGMNEAGLCFSTMSLSATRVPPSDERPHLAGAFWWQYILDTCATIEDLRTAAEKVRISDTEDHYLVCDRTGACAVVECLEGRMIIRTGPDLPVRALANATYGESLAFWRSKPDGPVDSYSSVHRFYRLASGLSKFTERGAEKAVEYAFGLLAGVAAKNTRWSFVCDTGNRVFYLRSSRNQRLRRIDLSKVDFACGGGGGVMLDAHAPLSGDITGAFQPYSHDEVLAQLVKALAHFRPGLPKEVVNQALGLFESFSCDPSIRSCPVS